MNEHPALRLVGQRTQTDRLLTVEVLITRNADSLQEPLYVIESQRAFSVSWRDSDVVYNDVPQRTGEVS
ncbi:hypothetical protein PWR63_04145 [Paraburkholderia sp. A2WS-5]|uniref:hypothetical protein n=1 Tax=Paraburkholderia sp. A2WS-5 TaxID=3028372 RepID=UPI003B78127A